VVVIASAVTVCVPVPEISAITELLLVAQLPFTVASESVTAPPECDIVAGPLIALTVGVRFTDTTCVT
jgi:hypothetical protein